MQTVSAAVELARRGIPLLRAKRVLDELLSEGRAYVRLPVVEDISTLFGALNEAGIQASVAEPPARVDVKAIREKTGLTQEQFALRFRIELDALRNWETHRRVPDPTARCLLLVIEHAPEQVERALSPAAPVRGHRERVA